MVVVCLSQEQEAPGEKRSRDMIRRRLVRVSNGNRFQVFCAP